MNIAHNTQIVQKPKGNVSLFDIRLVTSPLLLVAGATVGSDVDASSYPASIIVVVHDVPWQQPRFSPNGHQGVVPHYNARRTSCVSKDSKGTTSFYGRLVEVPSQLLPVGKPINGGVHGGVRVRG